MTEGEEIAQLAELAGIAASYHDQNNRLVETPLSCRQATLEGLGFGTASPASRNHTRERLHALREALLPRVVVYDADAAIRLPLRRPLRNAATWSIELESGESREGRTSGDGRELLISALPAGYHRLTLRADGAGVRTLLIAAPARCWQPAEIVGGRRGFGFTAQIYGLRSDRQFGIGDFTDARELARGLGRWGASFLGLSPAHALFQADPSRYSPYSPSSRLFLQTSLIDPTEIDEGAPSVIAQITRSGELRTRLERARAAPLIDYQDVWRLKQELFEALWSAFGHSASSEFDAFRRKGGEALRHYALFEALSEHLARGGASSSDMWPEPFRRLDSPEIEQFARECADRVSFYAWLQWIADRQFEAAHLAARQSGMAIGLYRDLAVGSDRSGAETWCAPGRYLSKMSIGAPPDPLGPNGQDWGLPPLDPIALEAKELRPFRDLVVANMRHAGALRIDHAFQLRRLFLIPVGEKPDAGAYVSYPLEALLGVLRVESHRAQCLVIAEDLGTAPRGFSTAIMRAGVLSYRLLSFERNASGGFTSPHDYPREALAAVSTHDLPTFKGWWRGVDVDLRECFGFFDAPLAETERTLRAQDRLRLMTALAEEGLSAKDADVSEARPPATQVLQFLSRTPCALTAIQLEDAIGETQQANLPGPSTGHPNWRRRLSRTVAEIIADHGPAARSAAIVGLDGRGLAPAPVRLAAAPPRATYRLQFNRDFRFEDATKITPYLRDLGISHVYASPITRAAPGSMHGYDVQDYNEINPELGGLADFLEFSDALRAHGLGLIVDFVPNHMGIAGPGNGWWTSVLEWGERSPDADVFDIDFHSPHAPGKVLLPVLGAAFANALQGGDISLRFAAEHGAFVIKYFDQTFPVTPFSYPEILAHRRRGARGPDALDEALDACLALPKVSSAEALTAAGAKVKSILGAAAERPALARAIEVALSAFDPKTEWGRRALDALLDQQNYRLALWRLASSEINYRRFFDISTLAAVRVEDEKIFARTHDLLFNLVRQGRIQGVRLDHIDGLADPAAYLERLQSSLGPGFYVLVEKILGSDEDLRDWPIAGTTGYETLAEVDQLFVDPSNAQKFAALYEEATGDFTPYEEQLVAIKSGLLKSSFGGELETLTRDIDAIAKARPFSLDLDKGEIRAALVALISSFPVYRSYTSERGPDAEDRTILAKATSAARKSVASSTHPALDFVVSSLGSGACDAIHLRAIRRFQQLTGPLMAKSLEDTLFYRYGRLIALNEVGGDPSQFGKLPAEFHASMSLRAQKWPAALSANSTHDTKRGEDARSRLIALTAAPELWSRVWLKFEKAFARAERRPDACDSYFLFQSVLAALPIELIEDPADVPARRAFAERIAKYAEKALREAKRRTSWTEPNKAYEEDVRSCLRDLFDDHNGFLDDIAPLARQIAALGAHLSFSRAVVKCALPGIPDIYQGSEFWDFSLVDPDNRRPVDYTARAKALENAPHLATLLSNWGDGRVKQAAIARMLADRRASPELYSDGNYRPLTMHGDNSGNFFAFERARGGDSLVIVARIRFAPEQFTHSGSETLLDLPEGRWRNLLDGDTLQSEGLFAVEQALGLWPAIALRKTR